MFEVVWRVETEQNMCAADFVLEKLEKAGAWL